MYLYQCTRKVNLCFPSLCSSEHEYFLVLQYRETTDICHVTTIGMDLIPAISICKKSIIIYLKIIDKILAHQVLIFMEKYLIWHINP